MPIYEYICDGCGHPFEALVASAKVKSHCPQCGSAKVSRQFSTFAAHGAASVPCKDGACPSMSAPGGGGCSGGKCPFS